jgi:release factor glutamine methyltransferase
MAEETWTLLKVLRWTQQRFTERGLRTPRLDAEVLLAHALATTRVGLYTHFDQPLGPAELAACRELIRRRLSGEPVAYLVGKQEFWSLPLVVDPRVLIPRPETEHLVEAALSALLGRRAPRVADIGTGSGAVALAIAHERPDAEVVAVDRSPEALAVARANAAALELEVELVEGDLLAPLADRAPFDLIVSNPPYVREGDYDGLPPEVKREPRAALLAGPDGLAVLRRLVDGAPGLLAAGGVLALEFGAGQASEVAALMDARGYLEVKARRDLAGIERVVEGRRPA